MSIPNSAAKPYVLSGSSVLGSHVRNTAGEKLGKIEELLVDLETGRVVYALLSFGGFLGLGDKLFAIPWQALALDEDSGQFVVDLDKEKLSNAPGLDRENWSGSFEHDWLASVDEYYAHQPYWR